MWKRDDDDDNNNNNNGNNNKVSIISVTKSEMKHSVGWRKNRDEVEENLIGL